MLVCIEISFISYIEKNIVRIYKKIKTLKIIYNKLLRIGFKNV